MPPLDQVLRRKKILLTGGTGFLGKVFLYLMLRHHPEVERIYLLVRGDQRGSLNRFRREILDSPVLTPLREHLGDRFDRYLEDKISVVAGDITTPGLLADGVEQFKPGSLDAVVNSAGLVNFEASLAKAIEVNTLGVANVIDFCRKTGAALLHISTCYTAGIADGQRFEDDLPENWCPTGKPDFTVEQEIQDALAAIARVETESHDRARKAAFHSNADGDEAGNDEPRAIEHRRKQWIEEQLKDIGRQRAQGWGWPNTYSYTKSLGEQLVLAARDSLDVTVVRPSVIEGALADPSPGWNQGVNTSAPLTYLAKRGFRHYPAKLDLTLDVIPVDTVAHAMVAILGALIANRQKPVYQLCTSDRNPLPMRRLVELTGLANRREHGKDKGETGWLARHLEATAVSEDSYKLAIEVLPRMLKRGMELVRDVNPTAARRLRTVEARIDSMNDLGEFAKSLIDVYRPYILQLTYTFHATNVRALYASLRESDAATHPFRPEEIDWRHYWVDVHVPGLRKHIYPQLDLHTRSRTRLPRFRNLIDLVERAADRYGSADALVSLNSSGTRTSVSYRELHDRARQAGILLAQRGIKPGDRVLLIAENSPDWVMAYFAILFAGAVAVPLDHLVAPDELAPACRIAEPSAALLSSAVAMRLGGSIRDAVGEIAQIDLAELSRPFVLNRNVPELPAADRKSPASILFTSGTTDAPKGVMLTHGNFVAQIGMISRVFSISGEDTLLSLLPLHHTFEFTCGMLLPLASGASIAYPAQFDSRELSRTMAEVRPTALIGVPALWEAIHRRIIDDIESRGPFFAAGFGQLRKFNRRLDDESGINLGSILFRQARRALGGRLRLAVSGGSPLPRRVAEFFNEIGIRLVEGYGLTEAAPVLSVANPDEPLAIGSVGQPLNGIELRLDGETEGVGEIIARGPNIMAGYYRNQAATDLVLQDGWLRTGDLGRFDDRGMLHIVGRARETIVDSGGNSIYIEELEEAYGHSPHLKEIAVVGLNVGGSERVAALAVPAYGRGESRRAAEDGLRADLDKIANGLSPHKRIRILRFIDAELPRTSTRKIKRNEVAAILRRMLESGDARPVVADGAEIEPWLVDALAQVSSQAATIAPATRLIEDLGLDSLAMAELAEHIAAHTGREIVREQMTDARTVADLQGLAASDTSTHGSRLPSYARFAEPYTPRLPEGLRALTRSAARQAQRAIIENWLKPRILGRGNIPANRNVMVVANLSSHLDFGLVTYALEAMGDDLVVLAAKDYFFNTSVRRFLSINFASLIPLDREGSQLYSLDDALRQLGAGKSVLMFPEGTRSADGAIHEFKSGAGYLALRSGCDVLPILIRGTHEVLGKGSLIPRHHEVEVRIGSVISAEKLRAVSEDAEGVGAYRKVADYMRDAVASIGTRKAPARPVLKAPAGDTSEAERPTMRSPQRPSRARARRTP